MKYSTGIFALFIMVTAAVPTDYGHLQHITVPDYHPKLEFLGQHVDLPEIPTKVIKITKTVAFKVPVPYPVKVPHHVPYPVPVSKPYPVPVTKIVTVPEPVPATHGDVGNHVTAPAADVHGYAGNGGVNYAVANYGTNGHNNGVSSVGHEPGYEVNYNVQQNEESNNHNGYQESQQYDESKQVPVQYSTVYHQTPGINHYSPNIGQAVYYRH